MSRFPTIALLALLLASTVAACGNKGPLVRPSAEDVDDVSIDDPAFDAETSADEATDEVPVDDADADSDADAPPPQPDANDG